MSDLISRKAVMEELLAIQDVTYMSTCLTVDECKGKRWMIARAIDAVKDAPTVDAEPIKHGYWIFTTAYEMFGGEEDCWYAHGNPIVDIYCSECGFEPWVGNVNVISDDTCEAIANYSYCPNCGAKMKEIINELCCSGT